MSRWDDLSRKRDRQRAERGTAGGSFTYALSYPSEPRRIWRMLCHGEKDAWTVDDIHDLALFCEDFVLHDHVGVPQILLDTLGPDLLASYADPDDFPLFEFDGQLDSAFDVARRSDPLVLEDLSAIRADAAMVAKLPPRLRRLLDAVADKTDTTDAAVGAGTGGRQEFLDEFRVVALQAQAGMHSLVAQGRLPVPAEPADIDYAGEQLSRACELNAISISPGHLFRAAFLKDRSATSLPRKAYAEVASVHSSLLEQLARWTVPRVVDTPPVLTILLGETRSRGDLLENLVALRERFTDLRVTLRQAQLECAAAAGLKERLKAIEKFESLRAFLVKKAVREPSKTVLRRTWSIAKKGSVLAAIAEMADVLLEIGEERRLLGGLRRFVDLERLAIDAENNGASLSRLFGEVRRSSP